MAPKGYIYWVNKLDVSLSSIWMKNFSKSNPRQPFNIVRKEGEKECWKVKARIFIVRMKYTSAVACYQLTPRVRIDLHKGHYVPNSRSWEEGMSVREARIFVDLESEKLFHSAWIITGGTLRFSELVNVMWSLWHITGKVHSGHKNYTEDGYINIWDFIPA